MQITKAQISLCSRLVGSGISMPASESMHVRTYERTAEAQTKLLKYSLILAFSVRKGLRTIFLVVNNLDSFSRNNLVRQRTNPECLEIKTG